MAAATLTQTNKIHIHIELSTNPLTSHNSTQDDDEISTSPRGLCILYKNLLARKLSKPEDDRYRPKHVVFSIANKHHHLSINYSCVFLTEFTSNIIIVK